MKKYLILILLSLAFGFVCRAQNPVQVTQPQWFLKYIKQGPYTTATLPIASTCVGCLVYNSDILNYEFSNGAIWSAFAGGGGGNIDSIYQHGDSLFYNTTGTIGIYAGQWLTQADTSSLIVSHTALNDSLLNFVKLQTLPPTASLSADTLIYPYTSASSWGVNLHWSAGRQAATSAALATNPISTINVGSVSQAFSQPSPGGSVNGTQHVTMPSNTNTTLSNVVTTTDGKVTQANITFQSQLQIFAGFVSSQSPSDADIQNMLGSTYVGGKFSTTPNQSGSLSTPASSLYPCFVGFGAFTPTVNINNQAVGYITIQRAFVNVYGYTTAYTIAVAPFATAGSIDSYIVTAH